MCTIVCLFVHLIFSHGVVSTLSIYEFDSPSGIFRPSFSNDPGKLVDPLNKLILKGYQFNTVIRSLNIVFIGINIDFVISKFKAN